MSLADKARNKSVSAKEIIAQAKKKEQAAADRKRDSEYKKGKKYFSDKIKKDMCSKIDEASEIGRYEIEYSYGETDLGRGVRDAAIIYFEKEGFEVKYKENVVTWSDPDFPDVTQNFLYICWKEKSS